ATGGANTATMAAISRTIAITEDDPAAREARLEAPVASVARGVGVLVADAVRGRLRAGGSGGHGGGNSLTVAGRELAGAGAETLAAEYLAGGYFAGDADVSAAELLRRSGFSLAGGDAGRGFNFWGSGGYVSADGDHDGVDYDGDTSAFHLGVDTNWRDGLVGVAVARSDGDTDFTVTADGMKSSLETTVTSVHPYLTRRLNRAQLWLTAGHGSGDAELREPDAVIKTDITVTTAALGATFARDNHLSAGLRAIYTRAALDAATGGGRQLPKTTAASLRLAADAEANWTRGAWSPFATFTVRHDSGDADTGIAGDLGGGIEWRAPTVRIRLAAATSVAAAGPDEQRATLTVNKSSGDFALSLNLAADPTGLDTARLLHGEWRF
ncbi:MAG: autotransporter domain-containing protein, partial [Gammaproteobacteria bacterium]|nr:autotransporter domain-containing protein [Gammaproteobacteria bacterium]